MKRAEITYVTDGKNKKEYQGSEKLNGKIEGIIYKYIFAKLAFETIRVILS